MKNYEKQRRKFSVENRPNLFNHFAPASDGVVEVGNEVVVLRGAHTVLCSLHGTDLRTQRRHVKHIHNANISTYTDDHTHTTTRRPSGCARNCFLGELSPSPSLLPLPFLSLPSFPSLRSRTLPFLPLSSPSPPLEVGPLESSHGIWGSAVSSHNGVWGLAPEEIDFGAF